MTLPNITDSVWGPTDFFLENNGLKIDYVLEFVEGSNSTVVPLPAQPNSVDISKMYTENAIYTFKDNYAFRETAKARRGVVVLRGQVTPRIALHVDASIAGKPQIVNKEGDEHLKNFDKFIRRYHREISKPHSIPDSVSLDSLERMYGYTAQDGAKFLVLRCYKENIHARCTVDNFTYRRSTEKHRLGGFDWELSLKLYDDYAESTQGNLQFDFLATATEGLNNALNNVAGGLDVLTGIVEGYTENTRNQISSSLNAAEGVLRAAAKLATTPLTVNAQVAAVVKDVLTTLDNLVGSIEGVYRAYDAEGAFAQPWRNIGEYWDAIDFWGQSVTNRDVVAGFKPSETSTETSTETAQLGNNQATLQLQVQEIQDGLRGALALVALLGGLRLSAGDGLFNVASNGFLNSPVGFAALAALHPTTPAALNTPQEDPTAVPYITYIMASGETLLTVASRLYDDPNQWVEIARINGCIDAYTMSDGTPITAGTQIRLPRVRAAMSMDLGQGQQLGVFSEFGDDANYGVDLYIDPESGDLLLSSGASLEEPTVLSSNLDNLKQAILIMIRTAVGDLTADPSFGTNINEAIGNKFTEGLGTILAVRIREFLMTDPRIIDIRDLTITPLFSEGQLLIEMQVVSFNGDNISVILPV